LVVTNTQWNQADNAKRTIDQSPPKRNAAEITDNKCEGNYEHASDRAKLDYPFIFYGIFVRADKGYCKNNVGKGEPVISIKQERIFFFCISYRKKNFLEPTSDRRTFIEEFCRYA